MNTCGGGGVVFGIGCRREWTRGSREIVIAAENQVISGNCLIGRLQELPGLFRTGGGILSEEENGCYCSGSCEQ